MAPQLSGTFQGRRKVWKSGGASSNLLGIICPSWSGLHGIPGAPRDDKPAISINSRGAIWKNIDFEYSTFINVPISKVR